MLSATDRKQVESLVGSIVLTGQEAPENGRRIREDLYKKTMSADGVRSRYAVLNDDSCVRFGSSKCAVRNSCSISATMFSVATLGTLPVNILVIRPMNILVLCHIHASALRMSAEFLISDT